MLAKLTAMAEDINRQFGKELLDHPHVVDDLGHPARPRASRASARPSLCPTVGRGHP